MQDHHGFHVSADADELTRELDERLRALRADAAQEAEPFGSSAPVILESLVWFVLGLAFYALVWLWATEGSGIV